jgi:asparagine synthase (glutamine-hydrolysing)
VSAIAGVRWLDGGPAPRATLARISQDLADVGPDGETRADAPGLCMVHRAFHTDARTRRTPQPVDDGRGLLLSFDGRLDNADEIRSTAGARAGAAEPELVLAVYRANGVAGFAALVGDFALALWDGPRRRLVLAVDGLGRRPLYYHCGREHLWWASRCRPLARAVCGTTEIDPEFVADFVANRPSQASPFAGVRLVPGGHALVAEHEHVRMVRYWTPDPAHRVEHASDAAYEEHFRWLFEQAVACRLRADGPVACELSGGVDSASIACAADRLLRDAKAEAPSIHTVSHLYRGSATADETPFVAAVEARVNRPALHVWDDEWPLLQPLPPAFRPDLPANALSYIARTDHVTRRLQAMGCRVMLSGIGGDQLFWSQPYAGLPLADLLVRGRLGRLFRTAVEWSRWQGVPLVDTLWQGAVEPLLPRRWQARAGREGAAGAWFDPGFARRTRLAERLLPMPDDAGFRTPSTARQYGLVRATFRPFALERASSEGYVEMRYPYLDRRLVEFALGIPLDQKVRPGETRSVVRRALRGVLPDEVRLRTGKAGPAEAVQRALAREWPRIAAMLREPRLAELGMVSADAFRTAMERARHGVAPAFGQLHKTLSLEIWLRTLEGSPRSGDAAPPGWRHTPRKGGLRVQDVRAP